MRETILVPLDGSPSAESALSAVRALVRPGTEVVVMRVVRILPMLEADHAMVMSDLRTAAEAYVAEVRRGLEAEGCVARTRVSEGMPAAAIAEAAEEEGASLIVMATHARTGVYRFLFGSVAERVLRRSRRPILLSRAGEGAGRPAGRVLVPLKEPPGPDLLDALRRFAPEAGVLLLWVDEGGGADPLRECVRVFSRAGYRTEAARRRGEAAEEILAAAAGADLIAMETRGRRGPARWIGGSVTERVMRGASVPMLIVPERGRAGRRAA